MNNDQPLTDSKHRERCGKIFKELHKSDEILVMPNPWDIGTARLFENLGFKALATTSAGLAFSLGRRDGDGAVTADETFEHIEMLIAATSLPISADLENGFGDSPEAVYKTIIRAGGVGLSGASIEDATYDQLNPLYERSLAVERVIAGVEAARSLPFPFVFTARTEGYIRNRPSLDETLWRLKAFDDAGADVLYAPGLPDEESIRIVASSSRKPFNYVAGIGPTRFDLVQLAEMGVRRVTIGTSFARCALTAVLNAAQEVHHEGTFNYLDGIRTVADFNELIDPKPR